jgi:signal transduction histidine kinase
MSFSGGIDRPARAAPGVTGVARRALALISDDFLQPGVVIILIVLTAVQLVNAPHHVGGTVGVFAITAVLALLTWLPRIPIPAPPLVCLTATSAVMSGVLLPLAPTTAAAAFAFVASSAAGEKLASRTTAYLVAIAGAATALVATWLTNGTPTTAAWPWWLTPAIVLPVFVGLARRSRREALRSAEAAVTAAERARLADARTARYAERNRISWEIHDILGHSLSGITLQLELADALHQRGDDTGANRAVNTAHALALGGSTESRRAVSALRAETRPLDAVLEELARVDGATFTLDGRPENWGAEVEHAAFRIVQEALTNARKHAPGAPRSLSLVYQVTTLTVIIENAPVPARVPAPVDGSTIQLGSGLMGMKERATSIDATVATAPTAEGGWRVLLEVPR